MDYYLIKGTFHVVGYSPDGDSIKFRASNPKNWNKIDTDFRKKFDQQLASDHGLVQLRLQGVDALETHYSPATPKAPKELSGVQSDELEKPASGAHKQPKEFADLATDGILSYLGIDRTVWKSWGPHTWIDEAYAKKGSKEIAYTEKREDALEGYIVARDMEKNGRPIAWVFAGKTRTRDGSSMTASVFSRRVHRSANYHLLEQGLVYPYFFMTLPATLRNKLAAAAQAARKKKLNLWSKDKSANGVSITTVRKLNEEIELFPYLFRKLLKAWHLRNMKEYWAALSGEGSTNYERNDSRIYPKSLFETGNPYVFLIADRDFVKLSEVVEIKGSKLTMKYPPHDIVFLG
ncbi:MAG: thermonuclease family protein [Candidatus Promineifilaceae bacterium]